MEKFQFIHFEGGSVTSNFERWTYIADLLTCLHDIGGILSRDAINIKYVYKQILFIIVYNENC